MTPKQKAKQGIECWMDVPQYAGYYQVSNLGRVRSITRSVPHARCGAIVRQGQLLRIATDKAGYKFVLLRKRGGQKKFLVHRLVLLAFVGPCPKGQETCHGPDRRLSNNRLSNLRYGTAQDNTNDKRQDGTIPRGEDSKSSILLEFQVLKIKRALKSPYRGLLTQLAHQFGVTRTAISDIARGRTWKHV